MLVLALALVSIAAGAVREARSHPASRPPPPRAGGRGSRRRCRRARVAALLALGNAWWSAEADAYAAMVEQAVAHRAARRWMHS